MTLNAYISTIDQRFKAGNATEHSYRGDLEHLLRSFIPGVDITNEPKRIECGAPDYIIIGKLVPAAMNSKA